MSLSETAVGAVAAPRLTPRGLLGDVRLARLAARGDRRAFEAIFERYHQELYRYCRAILHDPDDAQDALQSTMASALRALPGDDRQIALRPWLYRVAHNEAISLLRQRTITVDPDRLPEPEAPGVHSEAETRERLRDLVVDLDHLPERQRGALVMRELSGLSYAEIGAALNASQAAARQAVYEARVALKELKGGREMQCETARRAMSERDGRVLRGRRLRAHLRTCESCQDFRVGIAQRRSDLRALYPPLPALAASGLLTAILGEAGPAGVGAATGAVAGGGGAGIAGGTAVTGSAAVKGASIAAAVVIGAGAADMSGVAKLPLVGERGPPATSAAGQAAAGPARRSGESATNPSERARGTASPGKPGRGRGRSAERAGPKSGAGRSRTSGSVVHGKPRSSGGSGALPATSNGTPPEHSQAGGGSGSNGHAGAGTASHGKAPASRPGLANAAANAPTLPTQARGKPGSPPGHGPGMGSRPR
jgi:RNA polymerase sigma factor (sigma-70 family)